MIRYTVIIPYRDRPLLLNKALRSIPERDDIQIIVINNNEETFDAECDFSREKTPVLLLQHPGGGPGGARNEGMKHSDGLYTIFCDADDYFIEGAFDAFDSYVDGGYDIVFFRIDSVDIGTGKRGTRHLCYDRLVSLFFENGDESALRFRWGSAWGKIYRTALLEKNCIVFGMTEEDVGVEDILFSAKAGYYASRISVGDECVYMITFGGAAPSLTESFSWTNRWNEYKAYVKKHDFLCSVGCPEFAEPVLKAAARVLLKGIKQRFKYMKSRLQSKFHDSRAFKILRTFKHKFDKLYFEIHLADHCNLNCAYCSHFSPLAEPYFCSLEGFRRDMARMRELFPGNQVRRIRLLGGEPLLHPELCSFIKCAAGTFPDAERQIVTNGILLPNQGDEFWNTVKSTGTIICMSQYPIALDYAAVESLMQKKGVRYIMETDGRNGFRKDILDEKGVRAPLRNWLRCNIAVRCSQLRDGKLYMCCKPAYVDIFNKAFSKDIKLTEKDCVDIYRKDARKTIRRYLRRPIPFCRHCDMKRDVLVPWCRSERKIEEWQ